jgi:hypothetical protein
MYLDIRFFSQAAGLQSAQQKTAVGFARSRKLVRGEKIQTPLRRD